MTEYKAIMVKRETKDRLMVGKGSLTWDDYLISLLAHGEEKGERI